MSNTCSMWPNGLWSSTEWPESQWPECNLPLSPIQGCTYMFCTDLISTITNEANLISSTDYENYNLFYTLDIGSNLILNTNYSDTNLLQTIDFTNTNLCSNTSEGDCCTCQTN